MQNNRVIHKLLEVIGELNDEIDDLRREIATLKGKTVKVEPNLTPPAMPDFGKPFGPYTYPNQPNYEPVTLGANCIKCGLKLEGVMSYCCPIEKCPTGLGGAWCSTGVPPSNTNL